MERKKEGDSRAAEYPEPGKEAGTREILCLASGGSDGDFVLGNGIGSFRRNNDGQSRRKYAEYASFTAGLWRRLQGDRAVGFYRRGIREYGASDTD